MSDELVAVVCSFDDLGFITRIRILTEELKSFQVKPQYPGLQKYESRLSTFELWPPALNQKPEQLAEAGLFYTGEGDRTKCYHCGGGIKRWEPTDTPWTEHARWYGKRCGFLLAEKGEDFINQYFDKNVSEHPGSPAIAITSPLQKSDESSDSVKYNDDDELASVNIATTCKVCMNNELGVLFLPCAHIVCCTKCALEVKNCPFCRKQFHTAVRVHFS
jgi:baculoviral IAP repeat-containing protein 7/8